MQGPVKVLLLHAQPVHGWHAKVPEETSGKTETLPLSLRTCPHIIMKRERLRLRHQSPLHLLSLLPLLVQLPQLASPRRELSLISDLVLDLDLKPSVPLVLLPPSVPRISSSSAPSTPPLLASPSGAARPSMSSNVLCHCPQPASCILGTGALAAGANMCMRAAVAATTGGPGLTHCLLPVLPSDSALPPILVFLCCQVASWSLISACVLLRVSQVPGSSVGKYL
ncbi:hypothetical protein DFH07DRAFT_969315 [Mycena maculata]|uniref:Uncharacterized protein n=1 Tax=Mycena maculata TaxID=230809 RepID=A0AAD7MSG3_9AGAR|nr:hypothetical protein DFH07DRAFT_969315 [Mycena maculata]